jgi:hypothetical protein
MTTNNNIEQKKKRKERLESSSNNTRSAQVQNRYEVCIYDKQTKKERFRLSMCVSLLVKVFSLSSAFRDTQKKKKEKLN